MKIFTNNARIAWAYPPGSPPDFHICALPFSLVMALMGGSLVKAMVRDTIRAKDTEG